MNADNSWGTTRIDVSEENRVNKEFRERLDSVTIAKKKKYGKRTKLYVPFAEKDQAKALGARWCRGFKTWYVNEDWLINKDITPFAQWLIDPIPRSHV